MILTGTFTYLCCQSCQQRTNCDQCQVHIEFMLRRLAGIQEVRIPFTSKQMYICADMEEDVLLDHLEELGIFLV